MEILEAVSEEADPPFPVLLRKRAGPRTCIATQDLVIGGLTFGLHTVADSSGNVQTLHPELGRKLTGISRTEELSKRGGPCMYSLAYMQKQQ